MGKRGGLGGLGGAGIFMHLKTDGQIKDAAQERLAACGPQGQALSLITGQESLEQLRELIIQYAASCPANETHLVCPFHIMGTLSYSSLTTLVNRLPRQACLDLFEMEQRCRSQCVIPFAAKSK